MVSALALAAAMAAAASDLLVANAAPARLKVILSQQGRVVHSAEWDVERKMGWQELDLKPSGALGFDHVKLDDEDQIAEQYTGLGKSHATMRVHAADFAPMEEALIETMRNALGDDFTSELEHAWRKAYGVVSHNMIRRGGIKD